MSEEKKIDQIVEEVIMRPVEEEITQSYIDYAMSVIVSRALPDVRDGLKPVIRRILVTMNDMWLSAWSKYKKSMGVVWQALRDYHPHGDSSVYQAMVRLAQPFSMRYPLVDGQGNFWSIDGDGAAAARYTEARMTKIAEEMMQDIKMDTVDWRQNYDQSRLEPISLPTKFPCHLCNGTMGIAVGMATNMPPHNLTEVIDACLAYIANPEITVPGIMEHIKGPDFPTGGMMFDSHNILDVYTRGRWGIVTRGIVHFDSNKKWQDMIIITELPYQVNKSNLVTKIGELVNDKKLEGIVDITDASNRNKIRVVITLRKGESKEDILVRLYKYTDLQTNFNVNNVALVEKWRQPRHLNILNMVSEFVEYRREVVYRRSVYSLDKAEARLHILEWLRRATDILDEVIATIRASDTREQAKIQLGSKFEFSDLQAEYILMLRLQTLVWLEIQKILNEIEEKEKLIEYLKWIINDPVKLDGVVIEEMNYMKDTYGDERRTKLSDDVEQIMNLDQRLKRLKRLDELSKDPVICWIWADYKIKVLYQTRILNVPQDTWTLTNTHTQDKMIAISDTGELVLERLKDLGKFTIKTPAMDPVKHYGLKGNLVFSETVAFDFDYLVILTNQNNIKKVTKEMLLKMKKFPTRIMTLGEWEMIIKVMPIQEWDEIWAISRQGTISIYPEAQVRAMGKTSWWVKAIDLDEGDFVADVFVYRQEPFVFMHDGKNGKLVAVEDLISQKRWKMKRGQRGVLCAPMIMWSELVWAIAIEEWAVNLMLESGRIDHFDSEQMELKLPSDGLAKITNGKIVKMRRPYGEKEDRRKDNTESEWDETKE